MRIKARKIISVFLAMVLIVTAAPLTASAWSNEYFSLARNNSYNKDGMYYMSYTVKNLHKASSIRAYTYYYDPSGKCIKSQTYDNLFSGETATYNLGLDFSKLAKGTYTFQIKLIIDDYYKTDDLTYWWLYNIAHGVQKPSISYNGYSTYYDNKGKYMHKISINCIGMKYMRLYCKVYNSAGKLMCDWGKNTTVRKTNNEVGWFAWDGLDQNGKYQPPGNYTFIVTNSFNQQVINKTLYLFIPQGG